MNENEYNALKGVRRSELWRLNPRNGGSPEKFKWFMENPDEPTPAMTFGSAVHKLLLEPDTFRNEYAVAPVCDRRTKEGRLVYQKFLDDCGDKIVISADDLVTANEMVRVLQQTKFVNALLDGAAKEELITWTDEMTGETCKIRCDAVKLMTDGTPIIIDYKTTNDASTDAFVRKAISLGYDFQSGMYCEGVERKFGKAPRFVFIAQEKTAPYAVNILEADEAFIQRGKDIFRELIGIYHECMITDNWWGYLGKDEIIGKLNLPSWASNE